MAKLFLMRWNPAISSYVSLRRSAPTFKFTQEKHSFLQIAKVVALSIANGLLNVNAPSSPDI